VLRRLGTEDWQTFRRVRLAALKEAPYAFGSTFEREAKLSEKHWRSAVVQRTRWAAELGGEVAGTVSAGPGEFGGSAALTALWVDPRFRGRGIGSALVEAEVNLTAERLYVHHGFARTGRVSEVRPGEPTLENEMSKQVPPSSV
jgi:ribosomal protein S18 acetylase RimI-like enzyme